MSWRNKSYDEVPALSVRGQRLRQSLRTVTVAWMFGIVWMTCIAGSRLTIFARMLGFNNFHFGLLAAVPFVATLGQLDIDPSYVLPELRQYHGYAPFTMMT